MVSDDKCDSVDWHDFAERVAKYISIVCAGDKGWANYLVLFANARGTGYDVVTYCGRRFRIYQN